MKKEIIKRISGVGFFILSIAMILYPIFSKLNQLQKELIFFPIGLGIIVLISSIMIIIYSYEKRRP